MSAWSARRCVTRGGTARPHGLFTDTHVAVRGVAWFRVGLVKGRPAMQPAGHLTIEYDAQSAKLVWRWHPALNTHEQKWTLRIPSRQFHQVLADFYAGWHDILQQLRFHAPLYPASQNLLKRRLELTGHLLPDSLDLASLAQPGDLIASPSKSSTPPATPSSSAIEPSTPSSTKIPPRRRPHAPPTPPPSPSPRSPS